MPCQNSVVGGGKTDSSVRLRLEYYLNADRRIRLAHCCLAILFIRRLAVYLRIAGIAGGGERRRQE
jgi:hypothetical protein